LQAPDKVEQARVVGANASDKTPPAGQGIWPSDHGGTKPLLQSPLKTMPPMPCETPALRIVNGSDRRFAGEISEDKSCPVPILETTFDPTP